MKLDPTKFFIRLNSKAARVNVAKTNSLTTPYLATIIINPSIDFESKAIKAAGGKVVGGDRDGNYFRSTLTFTFTLTFVPRDGRWSFQSVKATNDSDDEESFREKLDYFDQYLNEKRAAIETAKLKDRILNAFAGAANP